MKAVILAGGLGTRLTEQTLRLDAPHARETHGWSPRWCADEALRHTLEWYRTWHADNSRIRALTLAQIDDYAATT